MDGLGPGLAGRGQDGAEVKVAAGGRRRAEQHRLVRFPDVRQLGIGIDEKPVYLADLWPSDAAVAEAVRSSITPEMFK